jgi:myo-inositol 2-dehydrogenase / D-chiro-inositol 1-dehydrogenase
LFSTAEHAVLTQQALTWKGGFPQEREHVVSCVRDGKEPLVTGADGKTTLEIIYAAYETARTGCRVSLPFTPPA